MNRILSILAILIIAIGSPTAEAARHEATDSVAPRLLKGKEASKSLESLTKGYSDWQTAEISGKITSLNIFVKPSIKIFMRRGAEMLLSVRVPFKGEVARLELDRDSVVVVNKLNATYVRESLEELTRIADVTISDIQDVFLGRAFIAGRGTLGPKDSKRVDLYSVPDGYLVVPAPSAADALLNYGFYTYTDGRVDQLLLNSLIDDTVAELEYVYDKKHTDLNLTFMRKGKPREFSVELDRPRFGGEGFGRIGIQSGFRQLSPGEFIKKFLK